jgi:membrane protein DedA with SNARE-associated domain
MYKALGYLISSVSVLLLGAVAWSGTADKPTMRLCLILGMIASILGMAARWISFRRDEKPR